MLIAGDDVIDLCFEGGGDDVIIVGVVGDDAGYAAWGDHARDGKVSHHEHANAGALTQQVFGELRFAEGVL